jgi:hypothetical protein
MLCFRCEHRAQFLENGSQPRYECGQVKDSKSGCYMFKPCKPVLVKSDKDDPRPQYGPPMISSRSYAERLVTDEEAELLATFIGESSYLFYRPVESED